MRPRNTWAKIDDCFDVQQPFDGEISDQLFTDRYYALNTKEGLEEFIKDLAEWEQKTNNSIECDGTVKNKME